MVCIFTSVSANLNRLETDTPILMLDKPPNVYNMKPMSVRNDPLFPHFPRY